MSQMQQGLTTGEAKAAPKSTLESIADSARKYLLDFAALPTTVYWLLALEFLNSFRSGG